jgi:hypothetical protein
MTADALAPQIVVGLNAVIVAVTDDQPRVLVVPAEGGADALPFGPLDPVKDRTLELALRGWVYEQAGIEVGYVEQLYTFGDRHRDPRERLGGPRVISIGYLSLARQGVLSPESTWRDAYVCLPWEDWRNGRPSVLRGLEKALDAWAEAAEDRLALHRRRERIDIAFGLRGAPWDGYRALDRYELLYEAELVAESFMDRGLEPATICRETGQAMAHDHRRILATAISRLRGKIKYRPVVFELLPETFTLFQLQRVVEALAGGRVHKQNFRRLVENLGLVEGTGQQATGLAGRPAELFRFRRDVLRERPQPGVGMPSLSTQ